MDEIEEDFGQKIDLTVRIREILRNYASGVSILKELIQVDLHIMIDSICIFFFEKMHSEQESFIIVNPPQVYIQVCSYNMYQNADDSGATVAKFCYDKRHHGTSSMAYKSLGPYQGAVRLLSTTSCTYDVSLGIFLITEELTLNRAYT